MLLLLSLLGCSGLYVSAEDVPITGPFRVIEPSPGAWVSAGTLEVVGATGQMETVTLNGQPVELQGGGWTSGIELKPGIATLDIAATDSKGEAQTEQLSVLVGTFAEPKKAGARAVGLHLDAADLEGLGPVVQSLLDPSTLMGDLGASGPILQDQDYTVYIAGIETPTVDLELVPRNGFLDFTLWLPGLTILLDVETQLWFIDIDLDANIRMDNAAITGKLRIDAANGNLDIGFDDPRVHVQGVEFDVDGLADLFEDMFLTDEQAEDMLRDNLAPLEDAIPGLLDEAMGGLGDLSTELELLETTVVADIGFAEASVSPSGLDLALDLSVSVPGSGAGESLVVGVPEPTGGELAANLSDDALNQALSALWRGGALQLELPLEPGSIDAMLLSVFGGDPSTGGTLRIDMGLPPVVVGRNGELRFQLGETLLTVDTPGGTYGEQVELIMALDAAMGIAIGEDAVGAELSDGHARLRPAGKASAELLEELPAIEQTMGAGIGMLNSLLSFPLDESEEGLLGGITLPPLVFERDSSDRATRVVIDLEGWTP